MLVSLVRVLFVRNVLIICWLMGMLKMWVVFGLDLIV